MITIRKQKSNKSVMKESDDMKEQIFVLIKFGVYVAAKWLWLFKVFLSPPSGADKHILFSGSSAALCSAEGTA